MPDEVSHPDHYNAHPSGIECITIVQDFNFNIGNAMKYLWRCGLKQANDPITELQKARQYIEFEMSRIELERKQEGSFTTFMNGDEERSVTKE